MRLPVCPPVQPMLARLARDLPVGDFLYEPKWDGFRCLAFRDGESIELRSRNDRPLARYFPEIVAALKTVLPAPFVLDGELVVTVDGRADFEALMARLHPAASRAAELSKLTPATYIAFDVLAVGEHDLTGAPFTHRRRALEGLLSSAPPSVRATPLTADAATAKAWLGRGAGAGVDGVMAKARDLTYQPNKRAMIKVKHEITADCVVAGVRLFGDPLGVASLLLGLYSDDGQLQHVGVASSFSRALRKQLLDDVRAYVIDVEEHPWRNGFGGGSGRAARLPGAATRWTADMTLDWLPLRPKLVCEVTYDHVERWVFRHPTRFRRWRPDRDATTCGLAQLQQRSDGFHLPT